MKTQIIQLESHDDVISICDKMGWGQTGRILLVWPPRGRILNQRLDLVRLQRRCAQLGTQLALITRDPEVRFYARELNIPVFETPHQAQESRWRTRPFYKRFRPPTPRPNLDTLRQELRPITPPWPDQPLARLGLFTIGVLAILAIAAVLLPHAEVHLYPNERVEGITIPVQASPAFQKVNLTGVVPARTISVIVEGRDSLPVSGTVSAPASPATGEVRLTNLTDQALTVPSGTVVLTSDDPPIRFIITSDGQLPGKVGGSITLPVQALTLGQQGNLPPNRLTSLEGALGLKVRVTNIKPTSGGANALVPAPTDLDRSRLLNQLNARLRQMALEELRSMLNPGDILFPETLSRVRILERSYSPAKREPADELHLTLRLEFQAQMVSEEDLRTLAEAVLQTRHPEGYYPLPDSLGITHRTTPQMTEEGTIEWSMYAVWRLRADVPETQAVRLILGSSSSQAERRLFSALHLSAPPDIELSPSWWPIMPVLPFRIQVAIGYPSN
jgi:hypothetical protein